MNSAGATIYLESKTRFKYKGVQIIWQSDKKKDIHHLARRDLFKTFMDQSPGLTLRSQDFEAWWYTWKERDTC